MCLKPGMRVMHQGKAYQINCLADCAPYGEYWWCETIMVEHPETAMVLFKFIAPPKELHVRRAA